MAKEKIKKVKFSFKKLFFMKSFFASLVGKIDLKDKPLNYLSIVFLIAFDIFIFINLASGLDSQKQNITSPYERYSYECTQLFNQKQIFSSREFEIFYSNGRNFNKKDKQIKICNEIDNRISKIKNTTSFNSLYEKLDSLRNNLLDLNSAKTSYELDYKEFRQDYSSGLGGYNNRISGIDDSNIRADYEKILRNIKVKESEIKGIENEINDLKEVISLREYIKSNSEDFKKEKLDYVFWYPVYVTFMESILIIPILIFTMLLYKFAINRRFRILAILSSNLAFIVGIFTFFILIKVIYFILPHKLFINLITYLSSIKALAIWNYLLTIFGIVLFGLLMFFSQKFASKYKKIKENQEKQLELLNKERISKERYWNKACIDCNTKLLGEGHYCSNCGISQYKECMTCKNNIPKAYVYCEKCGTKN